MKLADTKFESSEAYLIKYGKNLSSVHISKDYTPTAK